MMVAFSRDAPSPFCGLNTTRLAFSDAVGVGRHPSHLRVRLLAAEVLPEEDLRAIHEDGQLWPAVLLVKRTRSYVPSCPVKLKLARTSTDGL
jgi:hypothetical protein